MLGQVSPGGRGNVSTCNICRKWVLFDPIIQGFCRVLSQIMFLSVVSQTTVANFLKEASPGRIARFGFFKDFLL